MEKERIAVFESKMQIPAIPVDFIMREQVLELLHKAKEEIIILQGNPGYGKTTIMAQYANQSSAYTAWYSFEELNNDEQQQILTCLIKEYGIWKQNGKDMVFLLDNLECIKNSEILASIKWLLDHVSAGLKVIIAVEGPIPDFFSRYIAAGNLKIISEEAFHLSKEEWSALVTNMNLKFLTEEEKLEKIRQLTDDWPVAAAFLLYSIKQASCDTVGISQEQFIRETMINEYINCEIWTKLDRDTQDFLMQTAVFDEFDLELCEKVLEIKDIKILYEKVIRKNFGIHSSNQLFIRQKYRYKPLLRLFFSRFLDSEQGEKLLNKAAFFYLKQKNFDKAAYYAEKTGNFQLIASIMENHGKTFLQENRLSFFQQWISVLTKQEFEFSSRLLGLIGEYYYQIGEYDQLEWYLNLADSMFGKENQYGIYRSLYRGLLKFEENPERYEKQINNALFFLKENQISLPRLKEKEQKVLEQVRKNQASEDYQRSEKRLHANTFGTFQVIVLEDGKELSWRTRKGCELFAYLIDLQGKPVERKKLLQELWKEEIPNNAVAMLHNMFYNIRKELSFYNMDDIIQYKNKKYSFNIDKISSDLDCIIPACGKIERKDISGLMEHSRVFRTYWGRYLEDMDNEWIREKQEYYEKMYVKGCNIIGEELMKAGNFEEALVYLRNALNVSSYSDGIVMSIINCYKEMGDLNSMKKQYEDFCLLLKKELNISPGEELIKTYRKSISRN